jgi:hypothetical protein
MLFSQKKNIFHGIVPRSKFSDFLCRESKKFENHCSKGNGLAMSGLTDILMLYARIFDNLIFTVNTVLFWHCESFSRCKKNQKFLSIREKEMKILAISLTREFEEKDRQKTSFFRH